MGTISDWITGSILEMEQFAGRNKPLTLDDALAAEELIIEQVDGRWVLLLQGFPRQWHETQEKPKMLRGNGATWNQPCSTLPARPGGSSAATSACSAQLRGGGRGVRYGIAVGMFIERVGAQERDRPQKGN